MPPATLIIPQFNRPDLTLACINSLRQTDPEPWPIVVVDDGSQPHAPAAVRTAGFHAVTVIDQPHRGISAAWNRGALSATTPHLVFLNNDTLFRGPAIDQLIDPLVASRAQLAGVRFRRETALPPAILQRLPTQQFVEGWCFAVCRQTFHDLGGFDETMPLYWSDTDFQSRLRLHTGDPNSLTADPSLPITHLAHQTTHAAANHRRQWTRDRQTFLQKWHPNQPKL